MKKRFLLGLAVTFLTLPLCVGAIAVAGKVNSKQTFVKATDPATVTLSSAVFGASGLTTSYQQSVKQDFGGERGTINYFLAKKDASNNLVLAPAGKVFNYNSSATYKGRVTNIQSITVNYTGGQLFVQEGMAGSFEVYDQRQAITSGTPVALKTKPNHFVISNSAAETTITSIQVSYTCEEAGWDIARLEGKFNGKASDSEIYTLTVNAGSVAMAGQNGSIALDNAGNFTMSLASGTITYTGTVSQDYRTLTFTGKDGSNAALAPEFQVMNRIYVVNDFEQYADRGTGYTADQTSAFTVSNLRGDYFVDAGAGSGNTWVSGSGFKIPSTANYLNLCTSVKHGGNQSMLLQGQKAGWVRLWNREVFDQNQHYNFGRGNRLSFWVYSGRNNNDGSGQNASNVTIRAQVYYQNFVLTDSNRNSTDYGTGTKDFTINSGTDWKECVINIDPSKTVYAINIMINNSGLSTDYVFMPIDDITIYTQPTYIPPASFDESATKITRTYHSEVTIGNGLASKKYTVKVGLGANGYTYAYAGTDMEPTGYSIEGNQVTITTTGELDTSAYTAIGLDSSYTFGNWTGTLSADKSTLTINKSSITGSIKNILLQDTVVLVEDNVLSTGSEGTAGLRSTWTKQYNSGSWQTDSSSADRIVATPDYYIEGDSGIAIGKNSSGYATRIILTTPVEFESISFWYFIPHTGTLSIRVYPYKEAGQTGGYPASLPFYKDFSDAKDPGWHYVNVGIDEDYRGSFAIFLQTNQQAVVLDYITYF